MKRHQLEIVVGAFVLLGIAALAWIAIRMGEVGAQGGTYEIRARIQYDWQRSKKTELGMTTPRWIRRILRTTYTFRATIGAVANC